MNRALNKCCIVIIIFRAWIYFPTLFFVAFVISQVDYFNNYLRDPKRPQLPNHPGCASSRPSGILGGGAGGRPDFSIGCSSYQCNPGSFLGEFNPRGIYGGQYHWVVILGGGGGSY